VLEDLGIRVLVVPPVADWPGSVYPANAGMMFEVDTPKPVADKRFLLSNLLPTRAGEKEHYAKLLAEAGIATEELHPPLRF
jgi:N-dimethylarginine dimethylaminohydrolase